MKTLGSVQIEQEVIISKENVSESLLLREPLGSPREVEFFFMGIR